MRRLLAAIVGLMLISPVLSGCGGEPEPAPVTPATTPDNGPDPGPPSAGGADKAIRPR